MTKEITTPSFSYHVNRKYKDSLFRLLFSEKEGALELYNALNGSTYENPDMLEITTIDDVIYMGIKNDLSFLVEGKMHLLEEQSSWSENMPLRGLFYFSNLYQSYVEKNQLNIYSSKRLPLPQPIYIVFYIGTDRMPEQLSMRLSDSFEKTDTHSEPAVEVVARILNVNYGKNRELLDRCRRLHGYSYLIQQVRYYTDQGLVLEAAMDRAIEDCIQQNILKEFLLKHRGEVCDVILTKYDASFHIQCEKEESYAEGEQAGYHRGIEIGIQTGIQTGIQQGRDQTRREMISSLIANGVNHEIICQSASITETELHSLLQALSAD